MNSSISSYSSTSFSATTSGAIPRFTSTGKAPRKRCAIYYAFSGKERDEETGFGYFGARYYDSELLTGWLSVDPMADKYPGISPYAYCAWNPVRLVDPDGKDIWKPDSDGNLIAEKNDNATTLAAFLNISEDNAKKMLENQGFSTDRNIDKGSVLKLNNVFTRSIAKSKERNPDLYYNCFGSAVYGTQGQEINSERGMDCPMEFDNILMNDYQSITPDEAKFGTTIIRFANEGAYGGVVSSDCMLDASPNTMGTATHGAVFYGKSNDGTIYVYAKNGWYDSPRIMKLKHLNYNGSLYGRVQGIGYDSGYYNKK